MHGVMQKAKTIHAFQDRTRNCVIMPLGSKKKQTQQIDDRRRGRGDKKRGEIKKREERECNLQEEQRQGFTENSQIGNDTCGGDSCIFSTSIKASLTDRALATDISEPGQ